MDTTTSLSISKLGSSSSMRHKLNRIYQEERFKEQHQHKFESLTNREVQVLSLLANDRNNPQIADELEISRLTVEQHRKNINRKLGARSFVHLFWYALAFNLI